MLLIARIVVKTILFCSLVSLVPLTGYGQDLAEKEYTRPVGLFPLTVSQYRIDQLSPTAISRVSWPAPSMNPNAAVLPLNMASPARYKKTSAAKRVFAGLLGAGLVGVGAYLVSSSEEGPNRVAICTLCSEPPASSNVHLQLTGKQGAGIGLILAGAGSLIYAAVVD